MHKVTKESIKKDPTLSKMTLKKLQEIYAENMASLIEHRSPFGWGRPFECNIEEMDAYSVINLKNAFDFVAMNLTTPFGVCYLIDDVIYYDRYE